MTTCWGITDGSAGMVAQVRALAQAIGVEPIMKKIALRKLYSWQPNAIYAAGFKHVILEYALNKKRSDKIAQPWPDLVISCGRKAGLIAMGMRHQAQQTEGVYTKFIHIQDPQVAGHHFDAVIAMEHDKIRGPNVITSRFALHTITPPLLDNAREIFEPYFTQYAKPYVAVLLGGSTNKYDLSRSRMKQVINSLKDLLGHTQGSLLITASRRTGKRNFDMLKDSFAFSQADHKVYLYNFEGENPYLGLLALADYIVVTNDSVNMMSEAYATGKPLYILPLPGHSGTKPARFAQMLVRDGLARPLTQDALETFEHPIDNEMNRVANELRALLGLQ